MPSRSTSSDRIPHSSAGSRWLWWEGVHRDHRWSSCRPAAEHSVWWPGCYSPRPETPAERTHSHQAHSCCSCLKCGPKRPIAAPRPIRSCQDRAPAAVVAEAVGESSSQRSVSDTPDRQAGSRWAHNTSTAVRGNCWRSDARHRNGSNTCSHHRTPDWGMWWWVDRWLSNHRSTVAEGLRRKCSLSAWFRLHLLRRIPVHHRHIGCRNRWIGRSMFWIRSSSSTCRIRNTVPEWWWWTSSPYRSRCDAELRFQLRPEWDRETVAGRNSSARSDRRVPSLHRSPGPSEWTPALPDRIPPDRRRNRWSGCRWLWWWLVARAAD